jgi:hypothetical protein
MGPGVEFLPDDVADDPPPPPSPGHRQRWVIAAAVAVAAVSAWALTRPSAQHRTTPRPAHLPVARDLDKPVPQCVGVPDCAVRDGVPAKIAQLVHAYVAEPARLHVQTVVAVNSLTLTDLLVERDIDVVHGSVTVLIRVQRGVDGTSEIVHAPPGVGSLLVHHIASGYVVRLQYLAPETVPPMLDQLRKLVRDPRLESL